MVGENFEMQINLRIDVIENGLIVYFDKSEDYQTTNRPRVYYRSREEVAADLPRLMTEAFAMYVPAVADPVF